MSIHARASALLFAMAMLVAAPAPAAEDPALLKDLTAVLMLLGMPCGEVVSYTTKNDNDHTVVCKDGNRYHVYVNAQGRVVVEKQ